jgi:two-component system cell cycle response regulator
MLHRTVLAVDDSALALAAIEQALWASEYTLVTATSGTAALAQVPDVHPDLVLLDLYIPDLDGLEVCRRLRADPATARLPIVLLSAYGSIAEKLAGFRAGVDDYLVKDADLHNLTSRLRLLLQLRGGEGSVG